MQFLFLIPARGGSKGIPRKNIKILGTHPLIYYSINCALSVASNTADICVSSDDDEIISFSKSCGIEVPFKRPIELSGDDISQYDVIMHAIKHYESTNRYYDAVVLLQPTSPFRKTEHLNEALKLYHNTIDMVVSVKKTSANPYFVLFEENKEGYLDKCKEGSFVRRQDCPDVWELNGAIYIINVKSLSQTKSLGELKKIVKYEMPEINSIDIDTEFDWLLAEYLLKSAAL